MDDFPAGPASQGPRRPPLSVVVPVRDGGLNFERCLRALRDSTYKNFELIVVDDGSRDRSAERAESFGATVVRNETPLGPAAARNLGAEEASAPLVFFLDADVALHPKALERAVARFESDPELAALFGSYDDHPPAPGVASQFRNLLHHYVHQQGEFVENARRAHTFWTGCGAIRRAAFLGIGGFDPDLYQSPAIEDIELGYRLTSAGYRIDLVRDIQATHLKRWTFAQMIRTDTFQRGLPWMLLMLRSKVAESDLNVNRGQRACVASTGIGIGSLAIVPWWPWILVLPLAGLVLQGVVNRRFYAFLARRRGWGFALAAFPLHYLYFCCCGLSVGLALGIHHLPNRRQNRLLGRSLERIDAAVSSPIPGPRATRARRFSRWTRP
jgi:glycosyltransferase involved in cell wall biosynthesis